MRLPSLRVLNISFNSLARLPEDMGDAMPLGLPFSSCFCDKTSCSMQACPSNLAPAPVCHSQPPAGAAADVRRQQQAQRPAPQPCAAAAGGCVPVREQVGARCEQGWAGVAQCSCGVQGYSARCHLSTAHQQLLGPTHRSACLAHTPVRFKALPSALLGLRRLSKLSLAACQLGALPDEVGELSALSLLDVSFNEVKGLPASLCGCAGLAALSLAFNPLVAFPAVLGEMGGLVELSLDGTGGWAAGQSGAIARTARECLYGGSSCVAVVLVEEVRLWHFGDIVRAGAEQHW